jgi:hypothetical protein
MLNIKLEERREKIPTNYLKNFKFEKIDKIKFLLGKLGYNVENNDIIKISTIDFDNAKECIDKFINTKEFKIMFNCKREVKQINSLDIFNGIINSYGFVMKKIRHEKRIDGVKKSFYDVELNHINIMKNFILREKEQNNNNFCEFIEDE